MKKLISVIVPCYNCEETICETIMSIEDAIQNSIDKCEVILINDGSTDNTLSIIEKYKETSKLKLVIINQKNSGVSVARNTGIDNATGNLIAFLDSDDMFAPCYLDAILNLDDKNESDVFFCNRTTNKSYLQSVDINGRYWQEMPILDLLKEYTFSKSTVGFSSFVYRRAILEESGVRFTPGARYGEDWEFVTKYLSWCRTSVRINCFYFYRIIESSVSHSISYSQTDAIGCAIRTYYYLKEKKHCFADTFYSYMYPRTIFSVAHRFGKANQMELFKKLEVDYDVKQAMIQIIKNKNADWQSRLAAFSYCLNPKFFCYICIKF